MCRVDRAANQLEPLSSAADYCGRLEEPSGACHPAELANAYVMPADPTSSYVSGASIAGWREAASVNLIL
jgi:hypothetical protein